MIIVMRYGATTEEILHVEERIRGEGLQSHRSGGVDTTVIGVIGIPPYGMLDRMELLPGVERVTPITKPYKLAAREFTASPTVIDVGGVAIGGSGVALMAGPCTVETREQLLTAARGVRAAGAHLLRGGAFKPRSTPYSFQGLKDEGLELLAEARAETGLPIITEVMEPSKVAAVYEVADVLQIGARNCQNYPLLHEVGRTDKPVMLKRGPGCSVDEWIQAAGADGLLIEVHPAPMDTALCDGTQSLTIENFADLAASVQQIAQAIGRGPAMFPDDAPVAAG